MIALKEILNNKKGKNNVVEAHRASLITSPKT